MFGKLKLQKASLSLSSVSNALKSSGQTSLTPELPKKHLVVTAGDQLGLPVDSILAAAYDPVQSLLAVSTSRGSVHVYGRDSVEVVFELKTSGSIQFLRFVKGVYFVCVESSGNVTVLSLHSKKILGTYLAHGSVTAVETDPSLDWLVLGLTNGSVIFYDVDRLAVTPTRVDNLQKVVLPKMKMSPVLAIEWHPRDIGSVLIIYSHCAVQYLLSLGRIKNWFLYILTPGCRGFETSNNFETGGKKKLFGSAKEVNPRITQALYHPNGLHIVTVHVDGTLVFWDCNDGTLLEARTVQQRNLHMNGPAVSWNEPTQMVAKWITGQDPEVTQIVVCGALASSPDTMHVFEFGYTLKYTLTSHEKQGEFYAKPVEGERRILIRFNRRPQDRGGLEYVQQILPIAAGGQPYFSGGHNPASFLLLSNFGALYLVPFQNTSSKLFLPPSLLLIAPPATYSTIVSVNRIEWFGVLPANQNAATRQRSLVNGGAAVARNLPRRLGANETLIDVLVTGHEDGTIKFLDVTDGDHHGEKQELQVNLKATLYNGVESASFRVKFISPSFECRHVVVGLANGNVAICKFTKATLNMSTSPPKADYLDCPILHNEGNASIVDISEKRAGEFVQPTFMPSYLLNLKQKDTLTCLKICNAGFFAAAYKSGRLIVCDIVRGPGIIMNLEHITKHLPSVNGECFVTSIEFTIMDYGQEGYSSVLMLVGTSAGGNFLVFKLVPQLNGAFAAVYADKMLGLNYKPADGTGETGIDLIIPINSSTGESAVATMKDFQRLAQNLHVPGLIMCTSKRDIRALKIPKQKLAHKVIDETCLCSGVIQLRDKGAVLATITQSGFIKLHTLPSLSDAGDIKIPSLIFSARQACVKNGAGYKSCISRSGDIFSWLGPTEIMNLVLYDETKNKFKEKPTDLLFNETAIIPPRPTSSALLWAKGQTAYVSSKDLAVLIAGPNRKPSKDRESELAYNISPEANLNHAYGAYGGTSTKNSDSAYAEPVRKGVKSNQYNFGTQGFMKSLRDGLDTMEETVNHYANGISESMTDTVESQKKSMYSAALKSKLGF
ncbi:hypothetical protein METBISCDRAFT_15849 [Metschnikowia bicuspidata]|uniref:Lethal giant larvae (Lgl)-like C-terminal domain-containing protein n=1 Tax=Metschnikowia bicuspidata TaxID=27322 RepID=A0A4P9ZF53_9ASCO|nr:hypothetical protein METBISCDRAFT_15849 [Metschnikowia bicuspidata]